jgi:hypothetical protein
MRSIYAFEGTDEGLDLVPLAGRRALDAARLKVGLATWRTLPLSKRTAIVEAGAEAVVDAAAVTALVAGAETSRIDPEPEPDPGTVPEALARLGVSADRWSALRALDRWALASLARRGRTETLDALLRELG